jgi:hypothetical protein
MMDGFDRNQHVMIPASRNRAPARSDSWERVIAPKTLLLMLATP